MRECAFSQVGGHRHSYMAKRTSGLIRGMAPCEGYIKYNYTVTLYFSMVASNDTSFSWGIFQPASVDHMVKSSGYTIRLKSPQLS